MLLAVERVALLRHVDLFARTPGRVLAGLARVLEEEEFPAGAVLINAGAVEDWLKKDDAKARVKVVPKGTPGAQLARLMFEVRGRHNGLTWLELRPHTGRKHQLRVQVASRGCPIFGDAKYGSDHPFAHGIALHARSQTFLHPTTNEPITVTAEVPKIWRGRFAHVLNATT